MDVISHGLWGGVALGRKSKVRYARAFFFGAAPDVFSFGVLFVQQVLGFFPRLGFSGGPPDPALVPAAIHALYGVTHSLVVFAAVFLLVWLIRGRPLLELGAWGFHVVLDIFSHEVAFFPTPFLWPLSDYRVDGVSWGDPWVWYPNLALLGLVYLAWFLLARRRRRSGVVQ